MPKCENFIREYKSVIPKNVCEELIKEFDYKQSVGLTMNRDGVNKDCNISRHQRQDEADFLDISKHSHVYEKHVKDITSSLQNVYSEYAKDFSILDDFEQHRVYTIKMQKTEPSQGYHVWHCENMARHTNSRVNVWTIYLNDGFEGGETEFLYQSVRVKPEVGKLCIFPASYTHTHRGNPPLDKTKYILTGWFEFC